MNIDAIGALLAALALIALVVWYVDRDLRRRATSRAGLDRMRYPLFRFGLWVLGLLAVVMVLPIPVAMRNQLLALLGIVLSAVIGLSSTTFVGNALAGLMLRGLRSVRIGDFVEVADHFGRVTDRGLLHLEIQTEDRDLTTLPNLFLVTNPVRVLRNTGTVVGATVSLGYDVNRRRAEARLLEAARDAGLEDPFVQVRELGDYSVSYRAAGVLKELGALISTRSRLRRAMLDRLQDDGVEIVSPMFVNRRELAPDGRVLPGGWHGPEPQQGPRLEEILFDKADLAVSVERMKNRLEELTSELAELRRQHKKEPDEVRAATLERRIDKKSELVEKATDLIEERERRQEE